MRTYQMLILLIGSLILIPGLKAQSNLEKRIRDLENNKTLVEGKIENKLGEMQNKVSALLLKGETTISQLKSQQQANASTNLGLIIGGILSFLALLGFNLFQYLFSIPKKMNKLVLKNVNQTVPERVNQTVTEKVKKEVKGQISTFFYEDAEKLFELIEHQVAVKAHDQIKVYLEEAKPELEKAVKELMDIKFSALMKELSEDRERAIKSVIDQYDKEIYYMENSRLLVLSATEDDSVGMQKQMETLGFKKVEYKVVKEYPELKDEFDLILFDDHISLERIPVSGDRPIYKSKFDQDMMERLLIEQGDKGPFLYFGDFFRLMSQYRNLVNAANSPFTLWARIMESLRYLEKKRKLNLNAAG